MFKLRKLYIITGWITGACMILIMGFMVSSRLAHASEMEDLYMQTGKVPVLNSIDNLNLKKLRDWEGTGVRAMQATTVNQKGQLVYTYGAQTPSVVCAILQVCDIELEAGEQVDSVNLGDSARWTVELAVSGQESGTPVQHLLVKPLDSALETSMVVTTDRRTYRMRLKSTFDEYMPSIAFSYPERLQRELAEQQAAAQKERDDNSITTGLGSAQAKTYLGDLNFRYQIDGDVSWRPIRVFDDGHKTVIEMPESMLARTAPSLLILEDDGGIFSDERTSIINYRLQGTRYIVDGLFDTAVLTMDVGDDQQRVVISREEDL